MLCCHTRVNQSTTKYIHMRGHGYPRHAFAGPRHRIGERFQSSYTERFCEGFNYGVCLSYAYIHRNESICFLEMSIPWAPCCFIGYDIMPLRVRHHHDNYELPSFRSTR